MIYWQRYIKKHFWLRGEIFHDSVWYHQEHGMDALALHLNARMLAKYEKLNREQDRYFYEHHVDEA